MPSGMMRKYFEASRSWPGPKRTPAKFSERKALPVPVVPCSRRTAFAADPLPSFRRVPIVR
jgi:hypothetical protein